MKIPWENIWERSSLWSLMLLIILTTFIMGCAYRDGQIPSVQSVSPESVKAGGSAFTLTVTGTQFTGNSVILWNGVARPTVAISSVELRALIPAADIAVAGTAQISVLYPKTESSLELASSGTPIQWIGPSSAQSSPFGQSLTKSLSITASAASFVSIMTASLPPPQISQPYNVTLTASGGNPPYTWGLAAGSASLPPGLTLEGASGVISGLPSVASHYNFAVEVTDTTGQSATQTFSISISAATNPSLSITTTSLSPGRISQPYDVTLAASGGSPPYTWGLATSSGALPPGLMLAATTGDISGTPSVASQYAFAVQVTDSNTPQQTAARTLSMTTLGVSLDQYGGREDINCASITPYFHLEKISSHWWFCDPLGNGFIAMSVGGVVNDSSAFTDCSGNNAVPFLTAKYGDENYNWGWQTLKRMQSWGFNSVGQDSAGQVLPFWTCPSCLWPGHVQPIKMPYIAEIKPAENASINTGGFLTSALKDEITGTNANYTAYRGWAIYDMYDPGLHTVWSAELASDTNPQTVQIRNNDPYLIAVLTDDSDFFAGAGASPDFPTGHTTPNVGFVTLITSPVQTYNQGTALASLRLTYTSPQMVSKTQATNPVTTCSISAPCSLRDYLWQKYGGSISALNTAWGSSYTTFDSTATQVTSEAFATGDGTTTVFTHTLAHAGIDPFSVLFSVAGTPQLGDCPWFHTFIAGSCNNSVNIGTLGSPTANFVNQAASTINYSTGTVTINFVTAPANGAAITVNYQYGGWMQGGTGLMDEDGSHTAWVGTNNYCLEGANPSYPTFFSCVGGGGLNNPVPNANANLGADLDNWVSQFAARYFKTMHDDLKAVSSVPYFGLDVLGGYGTSPFSKFLIGAAPYLDGGWFGQLNQQSSSSNAEWLSRYQYLTQYLGDKPFMNYNNLTSQADSSQSCHPGAIFAQTNYPTQQARGAAWSQMVQALFTTTSFNGDIQDVGADFWTWQDFQSINQGLVSIRDNAYDGHEDVIARVLCSPLCKHPPAEAKRAITAT